jgi:Do/DeqQ family serine protease
MTEQIRLIPLLLVLLLGACAAPAPTLPPAIAPDPTLPSLAPMIERVAPAVVNISTEGMVSLDDNPLLDDPFFRRFFGIPEGPLERRTQGLGSGVVIDAGNGYVITNQHVIAEAESITVTLNDGRQFAARVIGSDPETDIAVIRIPARGLAQLPLADSDRLRVGDYVVAIGNPFGLGQTVTSGIVSALGRSGLGIEGYEDFIQTDASINPGNSGGALVNLAGELVGVNTAILAPSGGNVGINFAIPSNMVRRLVEQLVRFGAVERGQLGVLVVDSPPSPQQPRQGALITGVEPGTAAAAAGLRIDDVVVAVDGRPVTSAGSLRAAIGQLRVDQPIELEILRGGRTLRIQARIGRRPE